jgi:hypothetical protein
VLALFPVFFLLLAALIISLLGVFRPKFRHHWLIATGGGLVTWILIWVMRARLPLVQSLGGGQIGILQLSSFSLRVDEVTWPFALAVVTLCLAVLLTDVGRADETSWVVWAGDLGLTALGLMAVLAENPMTLLIGWFLVDLIELGILLRQVQREDTRRRVVLFFSTNLLGLMSVLGAVIAAGSLGLTLNFSTIPSEAQLFLVVGVGLRMGVFPLQVVFLRQTHHQRGQGTLLRLLPPASSLPLLVYAAYTPVSQTWRYLLLTFAVMAALYGGIAWARARDEVQGRTYWIIGIAGLAFVGTLQFSPTAAMTWGLAMLYGGAALFLASVRTRWMISLGILGLATLTALPFTPTYLGLSMYQPLNVFVVLTPFAHIALLIGYLRHSRRQTDPLVGVERWVQVIYPLGLVLLPVTYIFSSIFSPDIPGTTTPPLWPIILFMSIVLLGGFLYWKKTTLPNRIFEFLDRIFSLRWLYSVLNWLYQFAGRVAREISLLLEGEGGVLWALVVLVLLISLMTQIAVGSGTV